LHLSGFTIKLVSCELYTKKTQGSHQRAMSLQATMSSTFNVVDVLPQKCYFVKSLPCAPPNKEVSARVE